MNDFTKIKWITIVIPVATLTIFEILRFSIFNYSLSIISSIFLLGFFAVGGFLFSETIFKYIKQKNDELFWERQRLKALVEHTSDGIIILDENRNVIDMNPAAERMTGWKASEVINKINCCQLNGCAETKGTCIDSDCEESCLNHECGHSKCWGLMTFFQKSCVPYVEMCFRRKDGIKIPVAVSYSYIPPIGDEKSQVKMVFRDISSRKELEKAVQTVAVLEERYRISREMHDGLAQELCLLNLKVKAMKKSLDKQSIDYINTELEIMGSIINNALSEVRQTIFDLKVRPHQMNCFTSWLEDYLKDFGRKNSIKTTYGCDINNNHIFTNDTRVQLARIVQETLNNIRKHAEASEVKVHISKNNNYISISISDNGKGFKANNFKNGGEHFGLTIMEERTKLIGGKIEILSAINEGTEIIVFVPAQQLEKKVS